ncbi:MAG: hypothetical protein HC838_00450 [Spirulinaceae cyanobacterium RM2_2_10]|nr:hypothetical protein [Spirulinaceae cyanobacterium SM2_1_0]NJO18832.1 hypothetical protein [Spirulinaceae cyanobacterium RM2_2_10]
MLVILYRLFHLLDPVLVPLCFVCAWAFALSLVWGLLSFIRAAAARAQTMHQIPCADCQFFTNDHRLKCPVHPRAANTEQAIDCFDFRARSPFA